jgi:hypothetical protein
VLACVALFWPVLPCVALFWLCSGSVLPCVALCWPVLACVGLCCPVLPCVALCWPVLPCAGSVLPAAFAGHYFPYFDPCWGDPGNPLAERSWAPRPKREPGDKKKKLPVRVKRSSILRPWKVEGPAACRNAAPVQAKRLLSPKGVLPST